MLNGTGVSSGFIPRHLYFSLISYLALLQLLLQAQEADAVHRFLFLTCSVLSHIAKPPRCVWVGWVQTLEGWKGVTHSPLSCFWQSHDNNLVVTLLVCMLWIGLLMMAWAGGAHLYCFKKHLCLDISASCLPWVCTTLVWERAQPEKHKRTFLAPPPGHELQSAQVWGVFLSHSAPCEHTVACSGLRLLCPHVLFLCILLSSQSIFISDYGPKIEAIPRQAGQLLREFWSLLCTMEACLLQSCSGSLHATKQQHCSP